MYLGTKYSGECIKKRFDKKGKVTNEDDLTAFIKAEGGVICATILYAFLIRLLVLSDLRRTHQKPKSDLEGQKKCGGNLFFLGLALYIAIFGLCIAGKLSTPTPTQENALIFFLSSIYTMKHSSVFR